MRADRLLTLLMLLQARGRLTAEYLSKELEVSIRTIYRDVDALSATGVPIYAERGPGGGIALLDRYRTTLTGLTENELEALFMLDSPAALGDLGVTRDLQAALRKLAAALPAVRSATEQHVRQRIHLDATPWSPTGTTPPHLQTLHQALWEDHKVTITYRLAWDAEQTRTLAPLGLVAKADTWYLICQWDKHPRVIRVEGIVAACISDATFRRPPDFNLAQFWSSWCKQVRHNQPHFTATVRIKTQLYAALTYDDEGAQVQPLQPAGEDGWLLATLTHTSFESARRCLLSWGGAACVLEPEALRQSVRDFAQQILKIYDEHN